MQTWSRVNTLSRLEADLARLRRGHARPTDTLFAFEPLIRASGQLGSHLREEIRRLLADYIASDRRGD
jgi:hypothetical protein